MEGISKQWVSRRQAGATESELNSLWDKHQTLEKQYKEALSKETRRLEVEPNHEWLKKNASKYGFKYVFEPKKKKS